MRSHSVLLKSNGVYLSQIADEEVFASQHLLLIALSQVVEICKLVERRMAAGEGRGSWQQKWVERDQLPYVQLTLPVNVKQSKRCFEEL